MSNSTKEANALDLVLTKIENYTDKELEKLEFAAASLLQDRDIIKKTQFLNCRICGKKISEKTEGYIKNTTGYCRLCHLEEKIKEIESIFKKYSMYL